VFRRLIIVLFVALFAVGEVMPSLVYAQDVAQAQGQPKRRTLFDFLFGGGQDNTPQPVVKAPVVVKPKKAALPPPPKPAVQKAATAVRLAVFGDIMASDLAAALDRLYTDDPNILVINQGVPSSGFARPDYFDWNKTATQQVDKNSFDIAVMFVGTNDRQTIKQDGNTYKTLTPDWNDAYKARVAQFVQTLRAANKPIIWVGLPAMAKADYSGVMSQINTIQQLAVFGGGGEFVDIYDRFVDDSGAYSSTGPDLNGNEVTMRRSDGVRFTSAGADKLAFYVSQSIKLYYRGGAGVGIDVTDALAGTDAAVMVRPPYQGLGQTRLLEVAGAVIPLSTTPKRATDLVTSQTAPGGGFDMTQLIDAPVGRADAFGVGKVPTVPADEGKAAVVTKPAPAATVTPVAAAN
jgi:uncharacterized protein